MIRHAAWALVSVLVVLIVAAELQLHDDAALEAFVTQLQGLPGQ